MKEELIRRLADWLKITEVEAAERYAATNVAEAIATRSSNLCFQTADYIFSCLQQEIMDEESVTDDFERPEEMAEGQFVRSH